MIISDQQREENFQEYLRLRTDPNYVDVTFDEQSGGVSAVHINHKFDSKIGAFGIKKGEYEKNSVSILRQRGHFILLKSELAANGVKTPDGILDGSVMEIKSIEHIGKWVIKTKFHSATKQRAEILVLYFHNEDLFSVAMLEDGWNKFQNDKDSQRYERTIRTVYCVVGSHVVEWDIPE